MNNQPRYTHHIMEIYTKIQKRQQRLQEIRRNRQMLQQQEILPQIAITINQALSLLYKQEDLKQLVNFCYNSDIKLQIQGTIGIRKLISQTHPPIQNIISSNIIPRLIFFIMHKESHPYLKIQSTWCLSNIAAKSNISCKQIIEKGGINEFIKSLYSKNEQIIEQSIWALGNIAGDSSYHRDLILQQGAIDPLMDIIMKSQNFKIINDGAWALSNLCRGTPLPSYDLVSKAYLPICKVLMQPNLLDQNLIKDCVWTLLYLSQKIQSVYQILETNIIPILFELLKLQNDKILVPLIRLIKNLILGDKMARNDLQIRQALWNRFEEKIEYCSNNARKQICSTVCEILSLSTIKQKPFYYNSLLLDKIMLIFVSSKQQTKKEIIKILKLLGLQTTSSLALNFFYKHHIYEFIAMQLLSKNLKYVQVLLDLIYIILRLELEIKKDIIERNFFNKIRESNIETILQQLQYSTQKQIYERSSRILQNYFNRIEYIERI